MCVFCEISAGRIKSYKVYEDETSFAFLDIADDYEGHTLVIPKAHYENICDIPAETLAKVMETVQKVTRHYMTVGYDGANICNNNGECAGQSVHHIHFHIIPRKNNDGKKCWNSYPKIGSDMDKLLERLKLQ